MKRPKFRRPGLLALAALTMLGVAQVVTFSSAGPAGALPTPPPGQPAGRPTATIMLGDSIAAGEGGRLTGNPDNQWTDRANGDPHNVYGTSWESADPAYESGCHRSDVSEVHGATATDVQINIACSGAKTANISNSWFKGESPQVSQLASLAQTYSIKAVVISIGANDVGWGDVAGDCVKAWLSPFGRPCYTDEDPADRAKIGPMVNGILAAIDAVRNTMAAAGYGPDNYRLVVQGYPVPLPRSYQLWSDRTAMGCPLWGPDVDWFRNILVPRINGAVQTAVHWRTNVQYLDISKALQMHELCNSTATLRANGTPLSMHDAEWVNALNHPVDGQLKQESFHPNAYGQLALQKCLRLALATVSTSDLQCVNRLGYWNNDEGIAVSPLPTLLAGTTTTDSVVAGTPIPANTCLNAGNGRTHLCFQSDGNLVVYNQNWAPLWSIGSTGAGRTCTFQWDGNLVVNGPGGVVWHSDTWGNPGTQLVVQNDGNVVIYNQAVTPLWATGTNH